MTNVEPTPTVASLLPPKVRSWVYALLIPANAGLGAAIVAGGEPKVYGIILAVVNGLGFAVANRNVTA